VILRNCFNYLFVADYTSVWLHFAIIVSKDKNNNIFTYDKDHILL